MDAFKVIIVVSLVASLAALAFIGVIVQDQINGAKIPDIQRGVVTSKAPLNGDSAAKYAVYLSDGRTLYIKNDTALYNSIIIANQTSVFSCKKDIKNDMILIEDINPTGGLVTSKAAVDLPSADYSIGLADGRILYVASNSTLYDEVMVNETYLFDWTFDFSHNLYLVQGANLVFP